MTTHTPPRILGLVLLALMLSHAARAADLPPLKPGDIVFQNTSGSAREAIMLASGTQYTHVGLVDVDATGRAVVIEAAGPVRVVPLDRWIKNGSGKKVTVKRLKSLSDAKAKEAVVRARSYLGRPYDHFYFETRDQIYCSELIFAAFKEGADITVGVEEKVRDLNISTAAARKLIQDRWRAHPLCKKQRVENFQACYDLILEQTLVTPASIARDKQVETIYTNFGKDAE
jgi:cell wall-associated NlpC family hydrolase